MAKEAKAADVPRFTKDQLLDSKRYADRRDALSVLLEDEKTYTQAEADTLLDGFMKGKVK